MPSTTAASGRAGGRRTPPGRRPAQGRRTHASRRASVRRRRRFVLGLVATGAIAALVIAMLPLARRAVNALGLPLAYSGVIREQAHQKHLDPALVAAVIYTETKFDPRTSAAGAQGLMQLMPATAQFLAHRSGATTFTTSDLSRPAVNIAYGSYYLRYLLNEYHGSTLLALAAYNGGETNVDDWVAQARRHGRQLRVTDIPFPETRAYVQRVLQARSQYRHKYAAQLGYR
ncbi:MAG: lytic transglycosylase domain-containing protein [Solirubrobacteraceae bacterium]